MQINIMQVLSPMEQKVYIAICKGTNYREIADDLGIKKDTVKGYWKRIKKKIKKLEDESDLDVIMDIFEEESNRSLAKSHTVKQMQFLTQTNSMHLSREMSPAMKSYYKKKTEDLVVVRRQMTEEEREFYANQKHQREDLIPRDVIKLERHYRYLITDPNSSVEELARMEVILRAYGVICLTPAINKLNAKTTKALRAKLEGFNPTLVKPGEGKLLPQGSRFLESVKNEEGNSEYSVWLVPKDTRIPIQQESKSI